jgi:hypothetical protein
MPHMIHHFSLENVIFILEIRKVCSWLSGDQKLSHSCCSRHGRMARGGYGLSKVLPGPCGQTTSETASERNWCFLVTHLNQMPYERPTFDHKE